MTLARKINLLGILIVSQSQSQSETDMSTCGALARKLEEHHKYGISSDFTTDGKRTVSYMKFNIPGIGLYNVCYGGEASKFDKAFFEATEKNNK